MRRAVLLAAALSTFTLTACGGSTKPAGSGSAAAAKPEELIIGKWEVLDEKKDGSLEFVEGGELVLLDASDVVKGKYKFVSAELVEVEVPLPGGDKTIKQQLKVKVDKDNLEMTDEEKMVDKFKRVK